MEPSDYRQIQRIVYHNVAARGYLADKTPDHIIRNNFIKAVEEMGEIARAVFDGKKPPVEELADVVIPLMVIAAEMDKDLLNAVIKKSSSDISRGVR